jgi:hypothetical protein
VKKKRVTANGKLNFVSSLKTKKLPYVFHEQNITLTQFCEEKWQLSKYHPKYPRVSRLCLFCLIFPTFPLTREFNFEAMGSKEETLVDDLKAKWQNCETNHVEVFRYKLNVTREKELEGNFKFFVQVRENPSKIFVM